MLNIHDTASKAASEFGLSMKDDPTLWPSGEPVTAEQVRRACNATALENARSALSRALGKIAETVATEMDVAIAEDGPLADLGAVLAQHVEDGPEIDLSGVLAAADWQARVEAMREAFGVAVQSYHITPVPVIDLMHYVGTDPRLDGEVMRTVATLRGPEHAKPEAPAALMLNSGGDDWDDELDATVNPGGVVPTRERGKPWPGKARRTKAEIAEDEAADAMQKRITDHEASTILAPGIAAVQALADDWDDEDEADIDLNYDRPLEGVVNTAPDAGWDDEPVATAPNLPGLATAAGIADTDMAAILALSKPYYSQIRHGKRPWPGVKPDQVKRLRAETAARREALDAIEQALGTDAVLKPEGV